LNIQFPVISVLSVPLWQMFYRSTPLIRVAV
jgi:hypothetical protein